MPLGLIHILQLLNGYHALVVGPVFTSDKKVMKYALKTEEAFEHLKYIKCLNKNKSKNK